MGICKYILKSRRYHSNKHTFSFKWCLYKNLSSLDVRQGEGSGWSVDSIHDIRININNYDPLASSSYLKLPNEL